MQIIRVGIVGLGTNTRVRHVPGLRACAGVEIASVCNRSSSSTLAAAKQFDIPKTFSDWRQLVSDPEIDAVVIGTWPSMHCEITLAALEAGKHVLTEARMACNAQEAQQMLSAKRRYPKQVGMIVPSPIGLTCHRVLKQMFDQEFIGQLQEVVVLGVSDMFADPSAPRHWRQATVHSGMNILTLGILHETLIRFCPDPLSVFAQGSIFNPSRSDIESGREAVVDVPDALHVLTQMPGNAKCIYHLSGAARFGPGMQIHWYGSEGTIKLVGNAPERLLAGKEGTTQLTEVSIPEELRLGWRVEEEFIAAIRGQEAVQFTNFEDGLRYMKFTHAVSTSLSAGTVVRLSE